MVLLQLVDFTGDPGDRRGVTGAILGVDPYLVARWNTLVAKAGENGVIKGGRVSKRSAEPIGLGVVGRRGWSGGAVEGGNRP